MEHNTLMCVCRTCVYIIIIPVCTCLLKLLSNEVHYMCMCVHVCVCMHEHNIYSCGNNIIMLVDTPDNKVELHTSHYAVCS